MWYDFELFLVLNITVRIANIPWLLDKKRSCVTGLKYEKPVNKDGTPIIIFMFIIIYIFCYTVKTLTPGVG